MARSRIRRRLIVCILHQQYQFKTQNSKPTSYHVIVRMKIKEILAC